MTNATAITETLRLRWHALSAGLPDNLFEELVERYSEPHRHYHTLEHIADCFEKLDASPAADGQLGEIERLAGQWQSFELALFYHDAIYDPKLNDNEQQSATLAIDRLSPYLKQADLIEIDFLIQATAHFSGQSCRGFEPYQALIVDIDLSILGSAPDRYDEYAAQIRREYQHVPDADYQAGRAAVLKTFLAKDPLYQLPWFQQRFQQLAQENLNRELRTGLS